jgi:hypothetical protein
LTNLQFAFASPQGGQAVQSPFRFFHSFVLGLFGALGTFALLHAPDWAKGTQFQVYAVPVLVPVLMLLFRSSRVISEFLLERMGWVRRLLAGRRHIEGDWPLVVVSETTGEMILYGFLTIKFEGGQYVVKGDDWHPDGKHAMDFKSKQSHQIDSTLHYWYFQKNDTVRGYTFMEFFPVDRRPERHTGAFHDRENPDVRFYARKMKYGWFARSLREPEDKRKAAAAFADDMKPKLPKLHGTGYKFDWG